MPEKKNTIGRFEILEKIGEGPIGAVYKALDPVIRRTVAIKVIKLYALEETTTFAEVFEKIYRVVRTSTSLNHPNICIIYDLSEEKKIPYITMEFVEGHDLDSLLLKQHQFKKPELLNILQQICDALDFAHKRNVIHQDLKSTNILVTPDLHVKITDFGIAGLDEIAAAQTKKLLSIPYYISPEQALGERVTASSDLFSLGVVIYHLLSGQLPFPGTSAANAIMMIARDNPAVPADLEKSGISREDWDSFFEIALAKSGSRRYRTAKEMLEAVAGILPDSDHSYFPFSFAGAMNDSTGKFEKTFMAESSEAESAGPTLMIDSSQLMLPKEESPAEKSSDSSAVTFPAMEAPPLFEQKPDEVRTILFEEPPVSAPTQMVTMPPIASTEPEEDESSLATMISPSPFSASPEAPPVEQAPVVPKTPELDAATTMIPIPEPPSVEEEPQTVLVPAPKLVEQAPAVVEAEESEEAQTVLVPAPKLEEQPPTVLEAATKLIQVPLEDFTAPEEEDDEYSATIKPGKIFAPETPAAATVTSSSESPKELKPTKNDEIPATNIPPGIAPGPTVIQNETEEPFLLPSSIPRSSVKESEEEINVGTMVQQVEAESAPTVLQPVPTTAPTVIQQFTAGSAPTVIHQMPQPANESTASRSRPVEASAPTVIQPAGATIIETFKQIPESGAVVSGIKSQPVAPPKPSGPPNMTRYMLGAVLTAVFIALIAGAIFMFRGKPEPAPVVQPPVTQTPKVVTPPVNPPAEQTPVAGSLMVTSDPTGATVFLQDQERGITPLEISELQFGSYALKVQMKGYDDALQNIEVSSSNPYITVPVTLNKSAAQLGTLVVNSEPAGAEIIMGNRFLGTTPKTIPKTRVGKYTITLKKQGYTDFTGTVRVMQDKSVTFSGQLAEIPKPVIPEEPPKPVEPAVRPGQLVGLTPDVTPPKAIKKVYAKYPDSAKAKHLEGTVRITLLVDETGHVIDMKIIKSAHPLLDEAVMKAYKDWIFEPATKQGVPVKVWISGTMSFQSSR